MKLTPKQYADSLRRRADYFESAEGGWRDDTAALLRASADCIDELVTVVDSARRGCIGTHTTCRRVLDAAKASPESSSPVFPNA